MTKSTKKILAIIMAIILVFSSVAVGVYATSKPTFSLNRVSETDAQVVVSVNLESGKINNANFTIKTSSNLSSCASVVKGQTLLTYLETLDFGVASNPVTAQATLASPSDLTNTGAYFVFTFNKANKNRVQASDFTLTEADIVDGVNIVNNVPSKFSTSSLTYTTLGSNVTITGCKKDAFGPATIPAAINGKTVVAIADGAFKDCKELESITTVANLTSIGKNAFENCSSAKTITIGKGVKSIGEDAFKGCTGVENGAFSGTVADWCSIDFGNANSNLNTIAKTFKISGSILSGTVVIPNTVTAIKKNAFLNFTGIKSITLGEAVATVGENAFSGCTGIEMVVIPKATTTVANNAFSGCTKITKVGYKSSSDDWKKVTIGTGNDAIKNATFEYYYGHAHDYKSIKVVKPTCTTAGYTVYKCTMCESSYNGDNVKATGHHSDTWKYDATNHWKICDEDSTEFNKEAHSFDANGGCKCGYVKALLGDLNNDSKINSFDALIILQIVVGQVTPNATQKALADVNKDGKTDSTDALIILQYTVGVIKKIG